MLTWSRLRRSCGSFCSPKTVGAYLFKACIFKDRSALVLRPFVRCYDQYLVISNKSAKYKFLFINYETIENVPRVNNRIIFLCKISLYLVLFPRDKSLPKVNILATILILLHLTFVKKKKFERTSRTMIRNSFLFLLSHKDRWREIFNKLIFQIRRSARDCGEINPFLYCRDLPRLFVFFYPFFYSSPTGSRLAH